MNSKWVLYSGVGILGLSLVLAACNNSNTANNGDPSACPATIKATGALVYEPANCTLKVGQTVTIEASGLHPLKGVTAGGPIDTNASTSNVTFTATADKTGKFEFFCQNHGVGATATMKGSITVTN